MLYSTQVSLLDDPESQSAITRAVADHAYPRVRELSLV
jgi:hypothetical protein